MICQLCDDVEVGLGLHDFVELDYVGVPDLTKNPNLTTHPFNIAFLDDEGFVQDLDGHRAARGQMHCFADPAKGSFADDGSQLVVPYYYGIWLTHLSIMDYIRCTITPTITS